MIEPRCVDWRDAEGNPEGGHACGTGFAVAWQRGPARSEEERNGAQIEEVLSACLHRLEFVDTFYRDRGLRCRENERAAACIADAIAALEERTANRRKRGVEGANVG